MAAAAPNSRSSGWATMARPRCQVSSTGWSGFGAVGASAVMTTILLASGGRGHRRGSGRLACRSSLLGLVGASTGGPNCMHHLLAVLFGAVAGAMSATVPIYAADPDPLAD